MDSHHSQVLVIGAGVCGLMTALVCASKGLSVTLVERRQDPSSEPGRTLLATSNQLLKQANQKLLETSLKCKNLDPDRELVAAGSLLSAAQEYRSNIWGTRHRSIVLDTPSLAFLKDHGVETPFPQFKSMAIDWGKNAPGLTLQYNSRSTTDSASLSSQQMLFQRDWAAQPSINELEIKLLAELQKKASVKVIFGYNAQDVSVTDHGISLRADGTDIKTHLLIIADGGGRQSITQQFGGFRHTKIEETLDVAVFDYAEVDVTGYGFVSPRGWTGVGCNGRLTTVDVRRLIAGRTDRPSVCAYRTGRELGLPPRLVEPPMFTQADIDYINNPIPHSRVLMVGDAAVRGSPLFGLGAQYGLLWAQEAASYAAKLFATEEHSVTTEVFANAAEDIISSRIEFETSCLEVLDDANAEHRSFAAALMSPALLESIHVQQLRFNATQSGGSASIQFSIDLARVGAKYSTAEITAIRQLGCVSIKLECTLRNTKSGIAVTLSPGAPLRIETAAETLCVQHGELQMNLDSNQLDLCLVGATVTRSGHAASFLTPLREMTLSVPTTFIDAAIHRLPRSLAEMKSISPVRIKFKLTQGACVTWGLLHIRFAQGSVLKMSVDHDDGVPHVSVEMSSGYLELLSVPQLLDQLDWWLVRPLNAIRKLSLPQFDTALEMLGGLASNLLKRIDLYFHDATGGTVVFRDRYSGLPLRLDLHAQELHSITESLLSSRNFAVLGVDQITLVR